MVKGSQSQFTQRRTNRCQQTIQAKRIDCLGILARQTSWVEPDATGQPNSLNMRKPEVAVTASGFNFNALAPGRIPWSAMALEHEVAL